MEKEDYENIFKVNQREILPKNKYSFLCIDGRNSPERQEAFAHFPGANLGHFASLLSGIEDIGVSVDRAKLYVNYVNFIGGIEKFIFHTDEHPGEIKIDGNIVGKTGCGHIKHLLNTEDYGLSLESKLFIFNRMEELENVEVLKGHHGEEGVFVINTYTNHTILNLIDGKQYFIYDKGYIFKINEEFLEIILSSLSDDKKQDPNFGEKLLEYINRACDKHFGITGKKLALGLPIYII